MSISKWTTARRRGQRLIAWFLKDPSAKGCAASLTVRDNRFEKAE
jgi:hypothetical protein